MYRFKTKLPANAWPHIDLNFVESFRKALHSWPEDDDIHTRSPDPYTSFERRCRKLRNVREASTYFQVYVKLEPTARTWKGVAKEVDDTIAEVEKIIASFYYKS